MILKVLPWRFQSLLRLGINPTLAMDLPLTWYKFRYTHRTWNGFRWSTDTALAEPLFCLLDRLNVKMPPHCSRKGLSRLSKARGFSEHHRRARVRARCSRRSHPRPAARETVLFIAC